MRGIKNRVASEAVIGVKKSEDNADVIRQWYSLIITYLNAKDKKWFHLLVFGFFYNWFFLKTSHVYNYLSTSIKI